jgi:nucleoside-triphosphatase
MPSNLINSPRLWLLTGTRGAGKTTFCRSLAAHAHLHGWDVAGLLSPAVYERGIKTGILAENVRTGETHHLAASTPSPSFDMQIGNWFFDRSTLSWGNQVIKSSPPCDLLILDELGPLEFIQQTGWQTAFNILHLEGYQIALVVIRPELQDFAHRLFTITETIRIDRNRPIHYWVRLYWPKIKAVARDPIAERFEERLAGD